jgi:hypothetical protein
MARFLANGSSMKAPFKTATPARRAGQEDTATSEAALCIRAEDVAIARHDVADTSAMNQWRAVVRSETPERRRSFE